MKVRPIAATSFFMPDAEEDWDEYIAPYECHYDDTLQVDELPEIAGRVCYQSWGRPNPKTSSNKAYLANIIAQQHFSVLEHSSVTFWISGVSRSLTHELVRHRHLSFSQVSQRYVDESPESTQDLVMHPQFAGDHDWDLPISRTVLEARRLYREIVKDLTAKGVDRKTARGAARSVLPNAVATELIVTGNMRTWRELLVKRLSPGADAEIRELAQLILVHLKEIAPNTFQDFE